MEDRRRAPRAGLFALSVALLVLLAFLAAVSWIPLRRARAEWRRGRVAEAIAQANQWSRLRLWPNQYHEVLAAAHLSVGNRGAAREHLDALRSKRLWFSVMPKGEVANRLFARGGYEDFLAYDDAVKPLFRSDEAVLYRAAALTANNRLQEAANELRNVNRGDVDSKKISSLERAIAQRKEGSYPYVIDRLGKSIAVYSVATRDVVAVNPDFAALIEKEAGSLTIEAQEERLGADDVIETTLDAPVQKAAIAALGGFRGSLVAIDPRTNEILAVASTRGRGALRNLAFEQQYEPGSVVKVLTGLNAFASRVDVDSMFPYRCTGDLLIDGRHFGDWIPGGHGVLLDFDEAFAESCNVAFADIGLRIGVDRLRKFMAASGFGGQTDVGLFKVPLGRTVGEIFNKFETAFYAIGIEHVTTNTLHLAMLTSAMAKRGALTQPKLVRARRSILGEEVGLPLRQGAARIASREAAERIVKAMVAVVTYDKGTGRRASINGISLALKTGTAGTRAAGYHAVVMAFAPVERPKIAFALIAEDAGPAEYAGAKIARDFLEGIRPRLHK